MGEVFEFNRKRVFTLEEARELLPIVRRLTKGAHDEVKLLTSQLSYHNSPEQRGKVETRVEELFRDWFQKMKKLGCEAKGMWLVDFDSGQGYYCWHYPEMEVEHFHGYSEGFRGRVKVH